MWPTVSTTVCRNCRLGVRAMSFRTGAAGGMSYGGGERRHGGPNRGGGRGRGRGRGDRGGGRGRGDRGGGRGRGRGGRGGGPPPGLTGREIGMWYKNKSLGAKKDRDKKERAVVNISREAEENIDSILQDVRRQSNASQSSLTGWSHFYPDTEEADGPSGSSSTAPDDPMEWVDDYQQTLAMASSSASIAGTPHGHDTSTEALPSAEEGWRLLDAELMEEMMEKQKSNTNYRKMLEFRQKLPSWQKREELLRVVRENQVVVISGETGCGKTTQVPQFILDDIIMSGCGSKCHVICTQPRRISAISVAQRVAQERGEKIGRSVGFQIRLENELPRLQGSILFCTTGILLRRLIGDPLLKEASHVILDEVHERNIQSDFLTIIMKDLLVRRPDLKLILMSATLNAEMFSQYFGSALMFHIPNIAFPVAEYYLEDILNMTRFNPPPSTNKPRAFHTRFGRGREKYEEQQQKQAELEEYLHSLEVGKQYPSPVLETLRNMDLEEINLKLMMTLVKYICLNMDPGAILIFLPGWDTITKMNDLLMADPGFRSRNYLILPLHSMMPTAFQQQIFDHPPEGVRKIVIATNIAETSITIDDVVYVLDCGKVKETTYDAAHKLACLEAVWVSKAAARQRKGRAGRVQPGYCFHLFTKLQLGRLMDYQLPEMLRTPLEELVLQIKILGLGAVQPFLQKAIEPPSDEAIDNALECLRDLNALDVREKLTPLGYHLANLPVSPRIGKIILFAAVFSCLDPVLTIASALGFKEPFVIPLHKQQEADAVKRRFAEDSRSDHIALLRAFEGWEVARSHGNAKQYCWDNFLSNNTLQLLKNMKGQFAGLLHSTGFIQSSDPRHPSSNINSRNLKLVKAVLCAGFYPNVVMVEQRKPPKPPKLITKVDGKVSFHPKSVNSDEYTFRSKFLIYYTKMKSSQVYIHDATEIPPFPLLFFGGDISVERDGDQETIAVDKWIVFQAPTHIAELVKEMRQQLDSVLEQKIAAPGMELYTPHTPTPSPSSRLIQAIIDLITTEDYSRQAERLAAGKHLYYSSRAK